MNNLHDLILVNDKDEQVGTMEKMEAHVKALLHRAFSVFVFNKKGEMLLQQRAITKYHSPGLWTNTCCSHPRPGESTLSAAQRRLNEELGFVVPLRKAFDFIYTASFDNGLTENEFDHVLVGSYDGAILPDPAEVQAFCFKPFDRIRQELQLHPAHYTAWFTIAFPRIEQWMSENNHQLSG